MSVDHVPAQKHLEQRHDGDLGRDQETEQHHHEQGIGEGKADARESVARH